MYMICTRVSSTTACIHIQYCILFMCMYIRQSIIYILVKMQNLKEREGENDETRPVNSQKKA